jgi:hydrogenase nickel incorporation protein HypA/HybF
MHEFSIVQHIIGIVLETATNHHVEHVSKVEVEIGKASGVMHEAMDIAWQAATRDTVLSGAILKINEIQILAECRLCKHRYNPIEIFEPCPVCSEINPIILTGQELRVIALET